MKRIIVVIVVVRHFYILIEAFLNCEKTEHTYLQVSDGNYCALVLSSAFYYIVIHHARNRHNKTTINHSFITTIMMEHLGLVISLDDQNTSNLMTF